MSRWRSWTQVNGALPATAAAATPAPAGPASHAEGIAAEVLDWTRRQLADEHGDQLREAVGDFVELLMTAELRSRDGSGEPLVERGDAGNGHRRWAWETQIGRISLAIPAPPGSGYFPHWLTDPGGGAEHAIVATVVGAFVADVTTGLVQSTIRTLGIDRLARNHAADVKRALNERAGSFRARSLRGAARPYLAIDVRRHRGRHGTEEEAGLTVIATAIRCDGAREIVGLDAFADDGIAWARFLRRLLARGLTGVRLVVSANHPGLRTAIERCFPGTVWQHCRLDALGGLLTTVPERTRPLVAGLVASIYRQPSAAAVTAQHARIVEQLRRAFPDAAALLAESGQDMLAFARFPREHWPHICCARPKELVNGANGLDVLHHDPHFFVLAPSRPAAPRPSNGWVRQGTGSPAPDAAAPAAGVGRAAWRRNRLAAAAWTAAAAVRTRSHQLGARRAAAGTTSLPAWLERSIVVTALAVSFTAHAVNLFNYPRYELDEGTYMSSAWSILNGDITPYPYGYGHPPFGWMQIAAWAQATGGFFTFGNALDTGRVLMLFYAVGSSGLVYLIAHRLSGRRMVGVLAMILFSLSPLSLVYQRQVYLDNIGAFWLLLSLYLIVSSRSRLSHIVGAGLAFGFALLSKEVFVVFLPIVVYGMWMHTSRYQHLFGLVTFVYIVVGLGSAFVLMAVLRGELLPYAWHLPWDHHPHLSMLDTLAEQARRDQSGGKLSDSLYTWTHGDALLVPLSIVATAFNLAVGLWKRNQLILALSVVAYWVLLLRGGIVLSFYMIVLIPLVALNVALALDTVIGWVETVVPLRVASAVLVLALAGGLTVQDLQGAKRAFTQHPTSAQTAAMAWVRDHVPRSAVVVINSYLYMDLRQPGGTGVGEGATYPYAHVYWNVAYDPELHDGLLQNNWDRIDYIVADSEMLHDIDTIGGPMSLIDTALKHSTVRQQFRADDNEKQIVISIYQIHHEQGPPSVAFAAPRDTSVTGAT